MELRVASDAEAEVVVDADVVGRESAAPRRAAAAGAVEPIAAAQQTGVTSRGSCGVCHAS